MPFGGHKDWAADLPFAFGKGPLPKVQSGEIDPNLQLKWSQEKMLLRILTKL